jgi:tetratricopeptide (TPR) repeat protein
MQRVTGVVLGLGATFYALTICGMLVWAELRSSYAVDSADVVECAQEAFANGDFDLAVQFCDKALKLDPTNDDARYNRALSLYERSVLRNSQPSVARGSRVSRDNNRDFDKASRDLAQLLERQPNDAAAHCLMGKIHVANGEKGSALTAFRKAVECDPTNTDALFYRGNLLIDQGKYQLAAAEYTRVIELIPDGGSAYFNRAICHQELGDDEAAKRDFATAADLGVE